MLALLRPEADESMRIRLKGIPQRYHEDHHIAAKGINSLWSISGGLIYRPSRGTPSQTVRTERTNHSVFHLNTLTLPGPPTQL